MDFMDRSLTIWMKEVVKGVWAFLLIPLLATESTEIIPNTDFKDYKDRVVYMKS